MIYIRPATDFELIKRIKDKENRLEKEWSAKISGYKGANRLVSEFVDKQLDSIMCIEENKGIVPYVMVLKENDEVVGEFSLTFDANVLINIYDVKVYEQFRRKGYAFSALSEVEKLAETTGYSRLSLSVAEDNLPARALYDKLGYRYFRRVYHNNEIVLEKPVGCLSETDFTEDKGDYILRRAGVSDAGGISLLCDERLGCEYPLGLLREKLCKAMNDIDQKVFVADCCGKVIGFIHVQFYDVLYADTMLNVLGLAVHEDFCRNGIGSALIGIAERWALSRGAKAIRLSSGTERHEAHLFYQAIGFEESKTQKRFIKNIGK